MSNCQVRISDASLPERERKQVRLCAGPSSLKKQAGLDYEDCRTFRSIQKFVLDALPMHLQPLYGTRPQEHRVEFQMSLNPLAFFNEQEYEEDLEAALQGAITLTGSWNNAQAATALEYMSQTWPTTGEHFLSLAIGIARNAERHNVTVNLPDGTALTAMHTNGMMFVSARGSRESLTEVAEQLAWLGSALRSSRFPNGIALCRPSIRRESQKHQERIIPGSSGDDTAECVFAIDFELIVPPRDYALSPGYCWHKMLRNPVLVEGFPVLRRSRAGTGLEVSLSLAARLVGADPEIETFDHRPILKGFSTMLLAVLEYDDFVLWHYVFRADGGWIAYTDHELEPIEGISLQSLTSKRHIVGWCHQVRYSPGLHFASSDMLRADLPIPGKECILDRVSISLSTHGLSLGASVAIGVKDKPLHLVSNAYIPGLMHVHKKHVLFWDDKVKRGWLINSSTALLYLVRASLTEQKNGPFGSVFLMSAADLIVPTSETSTSAIGVLTDDTNRGRAVYCESHEGTEEATIIPDEGTRDVKAKTKRTFHLFEHYVANHLRTLNMIMNTQHQAAGQNGMKLKVRVRCHLKGWNFSDLITQPEAFPRVATLHQAGWGWVDLIRSIGAVTILGRDFGELLRPEDQIDFRKSWSGWSQLPKDQYYLAISAADMRELIRYNEHEDRLRVAEDLLWHAPRPCITHCVCADRINKRTWLRIPGPVDKCSPVQYLLPVKLTKKLTGKFVLKYRHPGAFHHDGAFVFGNPRRLGFKFGNTQSEDEYENASSPETIGYQDAEQESEQVQTDSNEIGQVSLQTVSDSPATPHGTNGETSFLAVRTSSSHVTESSSSLSSVSKGKRRAPNDGPSEQSGISEDAIEVDVAEPQISSATKGEAVGHELPTEPAAKRRRFSF